MAKRTKIVCTLGPATAGREQIQALAEAGMDVARLNFSHGSHEWHRERVELIRSVEQELGRPIAILQDLSGPKLRIGDLPSEGLELSRGQVVRVSTEPFEAGPEPRIQVPIPELVSAIETGNRLYLDDGQIQLEVVEDHPNQVRAVVQHGGCLRSRKGIAAPSVPFEIASLTSKDFQDLDFGLSMGVDWIAISFVRRAADVEPVRAIARARGVDAQIIAKIEKPEAVDALDEILKASDGLMVARGDLGVEMPVYQVPVIQKDLIQRCVMQGKPVITATQMLESMTHSPRPTRAEVSDVANAIFDGTSAVMLSGETAAGEFPIEAVQTMASIAEYTERHLDYEQLLRTRTSDPASSITDAISQAVANISHDLSVSAILCSTTSGHTARMVSRMRPRVPVIAATANERTYRRLSLIWGVSPLLVAPTTNTDEMLTRTVQGALGAGWIEKGQTVVITLGVPVGTPGHTNLIKVQKV